MGSVHPMPYVHNRPTNPANTITQTTPLATWKDDGSIVKGRIGLDTCSKYKPVHTHKGRRISAQTHTAAPESRQTTRHTSDTATTHMESTAPHDGAPDTARPQATEHTNQRIHPPHPDDIALPTAFRSAGNRRRQSQVDPVQHITHGAAEPTTPARRAVTVRMRACAPPTAQITDTTAQPTQIWHLLLNHAPSTRLEAIARTGLIPGITPNSIDKSLPITVSARADCKRCAKPA